MKRSKRMTNIIKSLKEMYDDLPAAEWYERKYHSNCGGHGRLEIRAGERRGIVGGKDYHIASELKDRKHIDFICAVHNIFPELLKELQRGQKTV